MVDFISSWAEQIIVAVIIATILEMLLPNSKSKKYIKTVIGIYVLFIIISPFSRTKDVISSTTVDFEEYVSTSKINQTSMDIRLEELYINELEKDIIKQVEEQGYIVKKCYVEAELFNEETAGIKKISLIVIDDSNNIEKVEKVEVNIGKNETSVENSLDNENIKLLKKNLSTYYEISEEIITINNK